MGKLMAYPARRGDAPRARFAARTTHGRGIVLKPDHPAAVQGGTRFPTRLLWPGLDGHSLLKSGQNMGKIGDRIVKGRWRGFRVYTLTLEERKTCPRSCRSWLSCYGNNMQYSRRLIHGRALEWRLEGELACLQYDHPRGFAVRLHILGDFYSVEYVALWERWLRDFPALHVWGYTAWQADTPIGTAVASLRDRMWERFAVRTSEGATGPRTTVLGKPPRRGKKKGWIVCPVETGRSPACGACSLCWATKAPIAFIRH